MIDTVFKQLSPFQREVQTKVYTDILEFLVPYINIEELGNAVNLDLVLPLSLQVVYYYKPKNKYQGVYGVFYGELIKENLVALFSHYRTKSYVVNQRNYRKLQQRLYTLLSEVAFESSNKEVASLNTVLKIFTTGN